VKARSLVQTPIDTGNLRASAYVVGGKTGKQVQLSRTISRTIKEGMKGEGHKYTGGASPKIESLMATKDPWAVIGYTASYAAFVHEMDRVYKAPGTNWKFLENAVNESREDIIKIIKAEAKL